MAIRARHMLLVFTPTFDILVGNRKSLPTGLDHHFAGHRGSPLVHARAGPVGKAAVGGLARKNRFQNLRQRLSGLCLLGSQKEAARIEHIHCPRRELFRAVVPIVFYEGKGSGEIDFRHGGNLQLRRSVGKRSPRKVMFLARMQGLGIGRNYGRQRIANIYVNCLGGGMPAAVSRDGDFRLTAPHMVAYQIEGGQLLGECCEGESLRRTAGNGYRPFDRNFHRCVPKSFVHAEDIDRQLYTIAARQNAR